MKDDITLSRKTKDSSAQSRKTKEMFNRLMKYIIDEEDYAKVSVFRAQLIYAFTNVPHSERVTYAFTDIPH